MQQNQNKIQAATNENPGCQLNPHAFFSSLGSKGQGAGCPLRRSRHHRRFLHKITMRTVRMLTGALLLLIAIALGSGII
ncbi:MAG: hypothetical protein GY859_24410 [Desulfobacterales bacterium]|nr:hypothetical protein [Desulfobacterales bacterium]